MKTHQIEKKTEDLKAHLMVVKGDIDNHVRMLSDLNEKLKAADKTLVRKEDHVLELDAEIHNKKELLTQIDNREKSISQREFAVVNKEKEVKELEVARRAELAQEEREIQERIKALKDQENLTMVNFELSRGILESKIQSLETNIARLRAEEEIAANELTIISGDYMDLEDVAEALSEQVRSLEKILSEKEQEVLDYSVEAKITEVKLGLALREEELTKKERNYQILKGRLAKVMAKLYPGQNIDNLI